MENSLENIFIDYLLFEKYDKTYFEKNLIIPILEDDITLVFAVSEKSNLLEIKDRFSKLLKFKQFNKKELLFIFADLEFRINAFKLVKLFLLDENKKSLEEFYFLLFSYAIKKRASDIHFEAYEKKLIIRFRIDGELKSFLCLENRYFEALSSYLKLLSNLDITQKRLPQDGRFSFKIKEDEYDFRFSSMPTLYKESIVLRILDEKAVSKDLDSLGFSSSLLNSLKNSLKLKEGLILVSGPTGSGKTTTLYSILNYLNSSKKKIITIEDPVEYKIDYINQIPINNKIGLSFEMALKNILRQDPDIILIGEIRDENSLNIALQASLTGHLVFASIHSNSSIDTISRLFDLKAAAFLLASSLKYILAQRLVLVYCSFCKGKGCDKCNYTSYRGRKSIGEFIQIDKKISSLLLEKKSLDELRVYLEKSSFKSLQDHANDLVENSITSKEEILKVIYSC